MGIVDVHLTRVLLTYIFDMGIIDVHFDMGIVDVHFDMGIIDVHLARVLLTYILTWVLLTYILTWVLLTYIRKSLIKRRLVVIQGGHLTLFRLCICLYGVGGNLEAILFFFFFSLRCFNILCYASGFYYAIVLSSDVFDARGRVCVLFIGIVQRN